MAAPDTIRVVLQQPQESARKAVFELVQGRLPVLAVQQEFGLRSVKLQVAADQEPVVLGYRPDDGLSFREFVPNSEIVVCGTVAATAAERTMVSSATFKDGMSSLEKALADQQQLLLQQQQEALANQKREIMESIGTGKHLKAH